MVCEKCEKKLGTVITPDTWKDGAKNTTESGGSKLNENKALTSKKARFGQNRFGSVDRASAFGLKGPGSIPVKGMYLGCGHIPSGGICRSSVYQPGSNYCQGCEYKKGICAMWGKKVLDTQNYKQTN
ncbi:hypothetical protein QTO34_015603, partial [Cnephaeus nilssonii]